MLLVILRWAEPEGRDLQVPLPAKLQRRSLLPAWTRLRLSEVLLWKHRSDWERELEGICRAGESLLRVAATDYVKGFMEENEKVRPNKLFGRTAVEDAFNECVGMGVNGRYEFDQGGGVIYRGLCIAESSVREDLKIEAAHRNLIDTLKTNPVMREIEAMWKSVKGHSESMYQLLNGVLLAGDIVYPCRFCRSFFKA